LVVIKEVLAHQDIRTTKRVFWHPNINSTRAALEVVRLPQEQVDDTDMRAV
jgi:hypothetical protein